MATLLQTGLAIVAGGGLAAGVLVAEHYGLKRARLRRTESYVAGTLALNAGYLVYGWIAGLDLVAVVVGLVMVDAMGGVVVYGVYFFDKRRSDPILQNRGQLEETQAENEQLRRELAETRELAEARRLELEARPVQSGELLDMGINTLTAKEDLIRVLASLDALLRKQQQLQSRVLVHNLHKLDAANRARKAKQEAAKAKIEQIKNAPDEFQGKS